MRLITHKSVRLINQNLPSSYRSFSVQMQNSTLKARQSAYEEHQRSLPKLPIPDLSSTMTRYERSIQPFLTSEEAKQLAHKNLISFQKNEGPKLQEKLKAYASTRDNWLEDIWLERAYHAFREPLVPHSNWFSLAKDSCLDYWVQQGLLSEEAGHFCGLFSRAQIFRAFSIIRHELPLEQTRHASLSMNQYHMMFGVTRIPFKKKDLLLKCQSSRHIVLMATGEFYKIDVLDDNHNLLPDEVLMNQLLALPSKEEDYPPVSLVTALHRDDWAEIRAASEADNAEFYRTMDDALFTVSLDRSMPSNDHALVRQMFTETRNRWCDKAIQFTCVPNGHLCMLGEHSPSDAPMPSKIIDYCVERELEPSNIDILRKLLPLFNKKERRESLKPLSFRLNQNLLDNLYKIELDWKNWLSYMRFAVLDFHGFGVDEIKEAGLRPDFFGQLSILLAFYKIEKFIPSIYETASTRLFLDGRTETIRVMCPEAADFLKKYSTDRRNVDAICKSILAFSQAHHECVKLASNGQGIDRHLLGLRHMLAPGDPVPELFSEKDPAFWPSIYHNLSTSNMSPASSFKGLGFGPTTPTGYGVNYCLSTRRILYSISAWEKFGHDYPTLICPRFDIYGNRKTEPRTVISEEFKGDRTDATTRVGIFKRTLEETVWELKENYFNQLANLTTNTSSSSSPSKL